MHWPIPEIPEYQALTGPRYARWAAVLFLAIAALIAMLKLLLPDLALKNLLFYTVIPVLLIWCCLFGWRLNRYERSVAAKKAWRDESRITEYQWQQWCRHQINVAGNVMLTPEEEDIINLSGDAAQVPAWPDKARAMVPARSVIDRLKEIDRRLEADCPGYRHHLYQVFLLSPESPRARALTDAIFQQWDLHPQWLNTVDALEPAGPPLFQGLTLLITIQPHTDEYSEMIAAQLLCSSEFMAEQKLVSQAVLYRIKTAPVTELNQALEQFLQYSPLQAENCRRIWVSGNYDTLSVTVMQFADRHHFPLPGKRPLINIDFSFGPAGPLAFPLALAMLTETTKIMGDDQLLIACLPDNTVKIALMVRTPQ
ncbi:hypothetical protein ACGVWS_06700 [Enterobacteriaceae bacterium LUAb1]